eukprot:8440108-Ditylum_brightwellii.AAC.1
MGNTLLSQSIKANTIRLYIKAAAMLCGHRCLMNPLVSLFGANSSWIEVVIQEQHRWESMPNRQGPVTIEMILQEYHTRRSGKLATWDTTLGGDTSSKAFTQKDFVLLGKNGKCLYSSDSVQVVSRDVEFLEIRYRFQKNKVNGQKIEYSRSSNTTLYPVGAGLRIRRRAQILKIKSDTTSAVYRSLKGDRLEDITDKQIDSVLQSVAKSLYNLTNLEKSRRFSSHFIRVGACVLLHNSGKDGKFIKLRLHWKPDTFRLYLGNTTLLSGQHCSAVSNILDTAQA